MSLSVGTVTVADDGTATGSGMAFSLYSSWVTSSTAIQAQYGFAPYSANVRRDYGAFWTAVADGIVSHIVANAEVHVGTLAAHVTTESLGRTPNPNNANTPIAAPALAVDVPLTGSGTIT